MVTYVSTKHAQAYTAATKCIIYIKLNGLITSRVFEFQASANTNKNVSLYT